MTPVLFAGLGVGLGLFLVVRGLVPRPTPLSSVFRQLGRTGQSVFERRSSMAAASGPGHPLRRVGASMSGRLGGKVQSDLATMERTPDTFAIEKLTTALALAGIVIGLGLVLSIAGSPINTGLTFAMTVCALAAGFVTPDIALRSQAAQRRIGFRHALSSYLDLVNVLLAGGAGIETSLEAAADAGDGWGFVQLRHALLRARTLRQSPFDCLTELGDRIGVSELGEIAASVRLAGEQGARIKLSLAAKASAMRGHQMARIEAEANAATERMGLPTVLLFLGFMVLLGYPAMQQIVESL
ncbi:MAG: type II secretion system F family protein [Ilumatobacteraceae bacterium]